jgi:hypothetical protein
MNELAPPPKTKDNPEAIELVRAWIVDNGLQCSLNIGGFGENELTTWGILLSDVARHVANAHQQLNGSNAAENLKTIAEHFNVEIKTPTAPASGEISEK